MEIPLCHQKKKSINLVNQFRGFGAKNNNFDQHQIYTTLEGTNFYSNVFNYCGHQKYRI